jgi:hypothetical protein
LYIQFLSFYPERIFVATGGSLKIFPVMMMITMMRITMMMMILKPIHWFAVVPKFRT